MEILSASVSALAIFRMVVKGLMTGRGRQQITYEKYSTPEFDKLVGSLSTKRGRKSVGNSIDIFNEVFLKATQEIRRFVLLFEGTPSPQDRVAHVEGTRGYFRGLMKTIVFSYRGSSDITGIIVYSRSYVQSGEVIIVTGGVGEKHVKVKVNIGDFVYSYKDIEFIVLAKRINILSDDIPINCQISQHGRGELARKSRKQDIACNKLSNQTCTRSRTSQSESFHGEKQFPSEVTQQARNESRSRRSQSKKHSVPGVAVNSPRSIVPPSRFCSRKRTAPKVLAVDEVVKPVESVLGSASFMKPSKGKKEATNLTLQGIKLEGSESQCGMQTSKKKTAMSSLQEAKLVARLSSGPNDGTRRSREESSKLTQHRKVATPAEGFHDKAQRIKNEPIKPVPRKAVAASVNGCPDGVQRRRRKSVNSAPRDQKTNSSGPKKAKETEYLVTEMERNSTQKTAPRTRSRSRKQPTSTQKIPAPVEKNDKGEDSFTQKKFGVSRTNVQETNSFQKEVKWSN